MIKVKSIKNIENKNIDNEVIYRPSDKSFDFRYNSITVPNISLLILYIDIGLNSNTMEINRLSGCSPVESWINKKLTPPKNPKVGVIEVLGEYEDGCNYRVDKDEDWKSFYDESIGWFCMGDYHTTDTIDVQVFKNTIISIKENEIIAIWIKISEDDWKK